MREHQYDNRRIRAVLTGMVTDGTVLGKVASWWKTKQGLFSDDACNVIGQLCVDHYNGAGLRDAPGRGIETLYATWRDTQCRNADLGERVQALLQSLSQEYGQPNSEPINSQLIAKQAKQLFHAVKCKRLRDDISSACAANDFEQVDNLATEHNRSQVIEVAGIDLFNDPAAVKAVFAKDRLDELVSYPGDLGEFFANQFCRGCFISFMAPEGTGKSWFLQDVAFRALEQRHKVAYIDAGDNTEDQVDERFLMRAAGVPLYSDDGRWPMTVKMPKAIVEQGNGLAVECDRIQFAESLTEATALAGCAKMCRLVRSNSSYFRRICYPSQTATVDTFRAALRSWALDGFVPDVVVIDYADLIASPRNYQETRDKINDVWMALRALSQEDGGRLVVTATQTNRDSYDAESLRKSHIGEDKRKLAAVTAMFGINATDDEKNLQVYRINCTKRRRGKTSPKKEVWLAACLPVGLPAVLSLHRTRDEGAAGTDEVSSVELGAKKRRRGAKK